MEDLDRFLARLYRGEHPHASEAIHMLEELRRKLTTEPNTVMVKSPVTVVGDIHGQFYDLLELLAVTGRPPDSNFLFLGDFVDRGGQSIEVAMLVFTLRLRYPDRVHFIRGNHESRNLTQAYGFYDECLKVYGDNAVWTAFVSAFDHFPIAALIDSRILCVHGGLSPVIDSMDQIDQIERRIDVPESGPMCDLLWADPESSHLGFRKSLRGASYSFGKDVTRQFLRMNSFELLVRAHQVVMEGFEWNHDDRALTLFSAPNYCYRHGNRGAILQVDELLNTSLVQFDAAFESENSDLANRAHRIDRVFIEGATFRED